MSATATATNLNATARSLPVAAGTSAVVAAPTPVAAATGPVAAGLGDIAALPPLTRWRRALKALAVVAADPQRTDEVLVFSSYANAGTTARRLDGFFSDPRGQKLYAEHREINSKTIDLDALAALPDGTLGHAYAHFLRSRGLTPEVFDEPPADIRDILLGLDRKYREAEYRRAEDPQWQLPEAAAKLTKDEIRALLSIGKIHESNFI